MSMHRFSSFNNPAYRLSIDEASAHAARAGRERSMGRACVPSATTRCRCSQAASTIPPMSPTRIRALRPASPASVVTPSRRSPVPRGNGDYVLQDPSRYPFAFSDQPLLRALNRQLIKAKPEFHKATFLKPLHHSAEFCSVCHKVHLPYELNHYKWLRGQNHYDSFLLSGVSGHRVDSFYYPAAATPNCAHCHMPLVPSADPAARDFAHQGERSVHDHLFGAANTGVPHLLGLAEWSQQARRRLLQQQLARVDIFGLKRDGDIDGELLAPLRPLVAAITDGAILSVGAGGAEPGGRSPPDPGHHRLQRIVAGSHGARWRTRVIGRSGAMDATGAVDPWTYFINSYLLDRHGERIERRNVQDIFVALYDHQIPPGAAATVHYGLALPAETIGPIED